MSESPTALPNGAVLAGRFTIEGLVGQDEFAILYRAVDERLDQPVTLRELAPFYSHRDELGIMRQERLSDSDAGRLRHLFISEAERAHTLAVVCVFQGKGTAYAACRWFETNNAPLDAERSVGAFRQAMEALTALHESGFLHLNPKPTLDTDGNLWLGDGAMSRGWLADLLGEHARLFGLAMPPEMLHHSPNRSPATDLHMFAAALRSHSIAPRIPRELRAVLAACIADDPLDRPQSAAEALELYELHGRAPTQTSLSELDAKRLAIQELNFQPRECPFGTGVLDEPPPRRENICPACHRAAVEERSIPPHGCPVCKSGVLHQVKNGAPLAFCPACGTGRLRGRLGRFKCASCGLGIRSKRGSVYVGEEETNWDALRERSGRGGTVWQCDTCDALLDEQPDGRLAYDGHAHYLPEVERIAARLNPDVGDAHCEACGADYHRSNRGITLLKEGTIDASGFAARSKHRLLRNKWLPMLGGGKTSCNPGFVSARCQTEFDFAEGNELRLIRKPRIARAKVGETRTLEDWHRIGRDLPLEGNEPDLDCAIEEALIEEFRSAQIEIADGLVWQGKGLLDGKRLKLLLMLDSAELKSPLKTRKLEITGVANREGALIITAPDGEIEFIPDDSPLEIELKSGVEELVATAEDIATRWNAYSTRV